MKMILSAVVAALALSAGVVSAQTSVTRQTTVTRSDDGMRHDRLNRNRQVVIQDRIKVRYVFSEGKRVKVTTTFQCVEQRRGECTRWHRAHVQRDVSIRR